MSAPAVVIVEYDPSWPARFEEERARVLAACDGMRALEHIGSTSVPRLGAKPILDLLGGVADLDDVRAMIPPLADLGYEYVPEYEVDLPDRRYFRKVRGTEHTHHLHVVVEGGPFWIRHLAFRDVLRAEPETARAYEALKRALAARYRDDRVGYTDAKTDFIVDVLARAARTDPAAGA